VWGTYKVSASPFASRTSGNWMTVMAEPEAKPEPEVKQKRFFCENCEQELFLSAVYCDKCGGKIEWPEEYDSIHSEREDESDADKDDSESED